MSRAFSQPLKAVVVTTPLQTSRLVLDHKDDLAISEALKFSPSLSDCSNLCLDGSLVALLDGM